MKLQKSSLLLIVMAIFLLISIGSACASENITTDSDIEVADDGADVVLSNSDTVGNVPDDTNEDVLEQSEQEPTNTSIETGDNDTYKFSHDEEKSIPVQVKANNTHIDVNKSDLKISEGNKELNFEYNNTYVTIKEILTVGNHTITITYKGNNETYINSTKIITLQVSGNNTIETETSVVCNGKNIEIPVKVHDGVEYIELIKSNFNLTLVYTNETGNISNLTITNFTVNDGKIKFDTPAQLIAASLIIEHVNATEPKTVNIKISTEVKAEADKDKFKSEEVKNISITILNGQGDLINITKNDLEVFENGTSINFTYNNSKITLELGVGTHNLTINYKGNETYNASSADVIVKVSGNNTIITDKIVYSDGVTVEVPVKIFDGSENITLNNNLTVTLTYTNETGNVTTKNITDYTIGEDKITFTPNVKLIAASITLNYPNAEAKTVAIKLITSISANVNADKYNVKDNKTITIQLVDGQNNPLNITANDLKVLENGANVAFTYNNSVITITTISEGAHNLTIVYNGDETYNTTNTTVEMKVFGANQINVPSFVVSEDGVSFEIPIYIFNGLENITITKDNFTTMNLTYTDENGNVTTKEVTFTYDNNGTIKVTSNVTLNKASLTVDYIDSASAKTVKVNLASKVNATREYVKYRFNETDNITVVVYDYAGNKLNIAKDDLQVLDNGENIAFNYNDSVITVNLGEGVHNLTIVYKGNETYNSSSTVIKRGVSGDLRFNPDKTAVVDNSTQITITINLNDAVDPQTINPAKLNITVFWTLGNETFNGTANIVRINDQNVTFDMNVEFDSAYAVIKYSDNNLTANTTIKANTEIKVNDGSGNITKGETEDKTLTILITGLTGNNGHNINITKDNIEIWNGAKKLNIEVNGTEVTIKDALKFGVYNLTVKYLGDDTFIASNKNVTLTVYGINATSSINVNSSKKGEVKVEIISGNETATIDVNELTLNVTYKKGNDTIVIPVTADKYENGTLYFTLENGNFTTATLKIKYYETEANVTLNRIYNAQIVIVNNQNEYRTGNFTFRLVDVDDGSNISGKTVKLTTVGNIRAGFSATTDANGIASFRTINLYEFNNTGSSGAISLTQIDLDVGNHSVDLETEGNVKATKVTTNLTITQGHFKIVVNPYKEYYGTDKPVTVTVTNSLGEPVPGVIVKLTIDKLTGEYYLYTNTSGVGRISIYNTETKSGLVGGDYVFTVSNNDTVNIAKTTSKGTVTVVKIPTKISAKDVTVQYNSGTTSTIKITDKKTGKAVSGMYVIVRLYSTSKKYNDYLFQTNSKGQIAFSASLTVGKHKMVVSSADNRYSASSVTKTITVKKATAKITAKKVTDYYKGTKYFTVKLTNAKNKKAIYDAKINIKIFVSKNRYYNYNGNTGMNGKIKLALDSLKPGSYKVEVSGADSKDFTAKKVTSKIVIKKATAKLTPKKLTAKKGAKKYFKVTVKNKKTKKVIKGVKLKVKVYTGKKAKTYKVKTNSKGVAKLSTAKLKVGKHKVVVTSANKYVKAKKAKSTIKIKK